MPEQPFPLWMKILIIVIALPSLVFPALVPLLPPDSVLRGLTWAYPVYGVADALCAWLCYRQRPELTWILLAVLLLSHASILYLALQ